MPKPPSGTITFLFTDIEGSTKLAQAHPSEWEATRLRHHAILNDAIGAHHGVVFQVAGDAFCAAFRTAGDGVQAALDAQRTLQRHDWGAASVRARMGLHTGAAEWRNGEYEGYLTLARVQRIMSVGHGGQVLLSLVIAELVRDNLPAGLTLRDLGQHRLKSLNQPEHLFQLVATGMESEFPPIASLSARPNNLPVQLTSFIGREREMAEVKRLLETTRLLTLTGSGGTGKTRLSLELAAAVLDDYRDGVWFVELAPLTDPALVPITVASVLGVREEPNRPLMDTLLDWLRPKCLLFILDNCEHLIEACAHFADVVIRAGHDTRIVASSREALGIAGELAWRVPSLDVPTAGGGPRTSARAGRAPDQQGQPQGLSLQDYAAVRLFVERATFANAAFRLSDANVSAIAQICSRLDGIPLAIELAAARVKLFPPEQIATRLDDRFRLLTGGSRTALPRQQTLRSLIDWSHNLLSAPERVLLRRLAVFAGGWTLEAAQVVCKDHGLDEYELVDVLSHLVDKSLVVAEEQAGSARYRMLETIRQYAREKLIDADESETLRDRHLGYFAQWAEQAEPMLTRGAERATWLARLEADHDNLRAALEWACARDTETARWLAGLLRWFWMHRDHYSEALNWYRRVLALDDRKTNTKGLGLTLLGAGSMALTLSFHREAGEDFERAIVIWRELGSPSRQAEGIHWLGWLLFFVWNPREAYALFESNEAIIRQSTNPQDLATNLSLWGVVRAGAGPDMDAAMSLVDEGIALARQWQDANALGITLLHRGHVLAARLDLAGARRAYLESAMSQRQAGTRHDIAISLWMAASALYIEGDYLRAQGLLAESIAIFRAVGDRVRVARVNASLGCLAALRGNHPEAIPLLAEGLNVGRELNDRLQLVVTFIGYVVVWQAEKRVEPSVRLLAFITTLATNPIISGLYGILHERCLNFARASLAPAVFDSAWAAGLVLTLDKAVAICGEPFND